MRAHDQPHLRADQPAYISLCHTHTGSQIGYGWRRFSDLNRSGKLSAFSIESRFPCGRSCLGGWSTCLPPTHFPSSGGFCTGGTYTRHGAGSKHEMALRLVGFSFHWWAQAPQAAPDRPLQGAMIAPGRPRVDTPLRWPPYPLPLPVAHPVIPPFQFTQLGPAAEVPDEVIRPVPDLEVRWLRAPGFGFVLA